MTDSRLSQQTVEVAVAGSVSNARLAQQTVEVAMAGSVSSARLAQQVVVVAMTVNELSFPGGGSPSSTQLW